MTSEMPPAQGRVMKPFGAANNGKPTTSLKATRHSQRNIRVLWHDDLASNASKLDNLGHTMPPAQIWPFFEILKLSLKNSPKISQNW
jgi:hypothetical protein